MGTSHNDEYLWAGLSYANRFRPDLGYIEYCSHAHDVARAGVLRHIPTTFPADMLTRARRRTVLDLPFRS
jgi:hypothetical protein